MPEIKPITFFLERAPTGTELSKWEEFKKLAERVNDLTHANVLRAGIWNRVYTFGLQNNLNFPSMIEDGKVLVQNWKDISNILKAISLVERWELGVRFEQNGDITIMAPSWYTKEQIAAYGLSGWFIPIAIGIVVIAGVLATLRYIEKTNEALKKKYDLAIDRADAGMCADPESELCQKWEADKKTFDFVRSKTIVEEITEGAKAFGKTAKAGIGIGLAVGIALALFSVFRKR